ncbi:MAG: replication-associated recombination protein A, partial [Candidatus Hydrogenedentes bacterium]|nr:replication-associated recombination protein A [Candidatus Hydrogenedentota bacterium]
MARMLEAGDDPRFVARRMCIAASEDVGNADPMALVVATNAWQACEFIGMPEARIILAQAAIYIACAPKSNASYLAINAATKDVREKKTVPVPKHLQDGGPRGHEIGRGVGYEYPHDHAEGYVPQDYGVPRGTYYEPTDRGKEAEFKKRLDSLDEEGKTS